MGEMFGESLSLGDPHKWTWAYIPHIIQTPFYVYAYAFGELLVLSLYARYKEQGDSFIAQYIDFLASGGSQSPQDLLSKLDIDVTDPDFWQGGCDLIRTNLRRAQELAKAVG
jgi:oligoendopeptidase F